MYARPSLLFYNNECCFKEVSHIKTIHFWCILTECTIFKEENHTLNLPNSFFSSVWQSHPNWLGHTSFCPQAGIWNFLCDSPGSEWGCPPSCQIAQLQMLMFLSPYLSFAGFTQWKRRNLQVSPMFHPPSVGEVIQTGKISKIDNWDDMFTLPHKVMVHKLGMWIGSSTWLFRGLRHRPISQWPLAQVHHPCCPTAIVQICSQKALEGANPLQAGRFPGAN